MYNILIKGPNKNTGINIWLRDWVVFITKIQQISIKNLSKQQICKGFIKALRDINLAFFN